MAKCPPRFFPLDAVLSLSRFAVPLDAVTLPLLWELDSVKDTPFQAPFPLLFLS